MPFFGLLPGKLSAEPNQQNETEHQRPRIAERIGSACEADDAGHRQNRDEESRRRTKGGRRPNGHAPPTYPDLASADPGVPFRGKEHSLAGVSPVGARRTRQPASVGAELPLVGETTT
jgi:hypothetical protein